MLNKIKKYYYNDNENLSYISESIKTSVLKQMYAKEI